MKFLEYPSISSEIVWGGPYYMWDKLDGINLRTEWSKKRGFYKLGARHTHLDDRYREEATQLIEFQRPGLVEGFRRLRWDHAICFFEFYSEHSLAGYIPPNETKMIGLLDVTGPSEEFLDTRDFHKIFYERVQTAKLLMKGNFNQEVYRAVKDGTFPDMGQEGMLVKGPPTKKDALPTMFKCKRDSWFASVRKQFGEKAEERF